MGEKAPHVEKGAEAIKPKMETSGEHAEIKGAHTEKLSTKEKAELHKEHKGMEKEARGEIEKQAISGAEQGAKKEGHVDSEDDVAPKKNMTYKSVMHRVDKQLPTYQRAFSKVIRNETVDKTSVIVGETVARPSAIIGASALAFFGLLFFTFFAKRIGFELPGSIFVLLVIGGWVLGIAFEFIYRGVRKATHPKSK